jgi:lipoate-protein ligase A
MQFEEKIAGGKLVCIEVWSTDRSEGQMPGTADRVRISGDFFLHPEDSIEELENSLVGLPLDSDESEIESRIMRSLGKRDASLVGVSPKDIARLFVKAVTK